MRSSREPLILKRTILVTQVRSEDGTWYFVWQGSYILNSFTFKDVAMMPFAIKLLQIWPHLKALYFTFSECKDDETDYQRSFFSRQKVQLRGVSPILQIAFFTLIIVVFFKWIGLVCNVSSLLILLGYLFTWRSYNLLIKRPQHSLYTLSDKPAVAVSNVLVYNQNDWPRKNT